MSSHSEGVIFLPFSYSAAPDSPSGLSVIRASDPSQVTLSFDVPADGNSPITSYAVEYSSPEAQVPWQPAKTITPQTNSSRIETNVTVPPYFAYYLRVMAANAFGESTPSKASMPIYLEPKPPVRNPSRVEAVLSEDRSQINVTWEVRWSPSIILFFFVNSFLCWIFESHWAMLFHIHSIQTWILVLIAYELDLLNMCNIHEYFTGSPPHLYEECNDSFSSISTYLDISADRQMNLESCSYYIRTWPFEYVYTCQMNMSNEASHQMCHLANHTKCGSNRSVLASYQPTPPPIPLKCIYIFHWQYKYWYKAVHPFRTWWGEEHQENVSSSKSLKKSHNMEIVQ